MVCAHILEEQKLHLLTGQCTKSVCVCVWIKCILYSQCSI